MLVRSINYDSHLVLTVLSLTFIISMNFITAYFYGWEMPSIKDADSLLTPVASAQGINHEKAVGRQV